MRIQTLRGGVPAWFALALATFAGPVATPAQLRPDADRARIAGQYGKLPLRFESNRGQTDARVQFLSRAGGYTLFLTGSEAVMALPASVVRMKLLGANPHANAAGVDPFPDKVSYFIGSDPRKWRSDVPAFAKVRYQDIYPGVDLFYYGAHQQLEYDLVVAPGANPAAVRLGISAENGIRLNPDGDLALGTAAGTVLLRKPVAYQQSPDGKKLIEARYRLHGRHEVTLEIAAYDHARPLVIDPTLVYATYLGGKAGENDGTLPESFLSGIAVDSAGSAYVTGFTASTDFPTANPFQAASAGGGDDVFVAKLKPDGSGLVYSTYLGGSGRELGGGIAVDSSGNAYITGQTTSTNFPTTPGAFQPTNNFVTNAFVTKLNAAGSGLVYSTYLGGTDGADMGFGIAVDSAGRACVAGEANSTDFPTTAGAPQTLPGGLGDAFAAVVAADGQSLAFSTLLGGSAFDFASAIAVDPAGNLYVTGGTQSSNFPTVNPIQAAAGGGEDAWVAKLNPAASAVAYATYLGGGRLDRGHGIAVDSGGNAYVTGVTNSTDFPTANAFQAVNGGTEDVFVAKLNPSGSALIYSTYLGGTGSDQGLSIGLDSAGSAYVTGVTSSLNFPTVNSLQSSRTAFVTKFSADGSALAYSTFLGGSGHENNTGIAVDSSCSAYVTGSTSSADFPVTAGAAQTTLGGLVDAFVAKISQLSGGIAATTTTVTSSVNPSVFGQQVVFVATVHPAGCVGAVPTGTVTFLDGATTLGTVTPQNGVATFPTSGLGVGNHSITASYSGDANFGPSVSAPLGQTVNPAVTATGLISSLNPAGPGQVVTLTATVAAVPPGAGTPTGTVTFSDGNAALAIVALSGSTAVFNISTLALGVHNLSAGYNGDPNFAASSSSVLVETIAFVQVKVSEVIHVTDAPASQLALQVAAAETVHIADADAAATSGPVNLSGQVSVTSTGFLFSRVTRTYNGTLTVMNASAQGIAGPIQIVLTNLTAGVTLANASGTTGGNPFITVPGVTTLTPGQSASVNVRFSNPSAALILFTPVPYSGTLL